MLTYEGRSEITRRVSPDVEEAKASSVVHPKPSHSEIRSNWKTWLVISIFCVVWFLVIMVAMALLFIILHLIGISDSLSIHLSISLAYLIGIPLTILFMDLDKQLPDLTGKFAIQSGKQAIVLLLAIPAIITIVDFILVIGYGLVYEFAFGVPEVNTDIGVDWDSGPFALGLAIASTVIIAPIAEELMFRGYLMDSIRKMHGDWIAIAISSLIFGLIHIEPYTVGMAAIGGLIYGYVRIKTGSLWPSIIGHMMWNGFALVVTYL